MVNITSQIVQRLSELGFEVDNGVMHNAVAYFIHQNLVDILGRDEYDEQDIDIVLYNGGLSISPSDANRFTVSVKDGKLVATGSDLLFSISKYGDRIINDRVDGNVDYRSVASEAEFALMKYSDGKLNYDLRAKNIGAVKTGKQIYQLAQNYPIDSKTNNSFLFKLGTMLTNKDIMSVNVDMNNVYTDTYVQVFDKLKDKYKDVINNDINKTR